MSDVSRYRHWEAVYGDKGEHGVSWFQEQATVSLEMLRQVGAGPSSQIIDIGGGASRLVDDLVALKYAAVTILDVSDAALAIAKARIGEKADTVTWIAADVTRWEPQQQYDVWHDRAAFHFLTEPADRKAYVERLSRAVRPGGHAIIATFALDGPERCSGLPVVRYDSERLAAILGASFVFVDARRQDHITPAGAVQRFQFSAFRRV